MKQLPTIFILLLLLVCCSKQAATTSDADTKGSVKENVKKSHNLIVDGIKVTFADTIPKPGNPPGGLPPNNSTLLAEYFNDSNYIQLATAEQMGLDPINDMSGLYYNRRPIVEIATTDHYHLEPLTHSLPFLVPEAEKLLDDIGNEFTAQAKKLTGKDGYKVIVTSVLRTPQTVKSLMRVNKNAVENSTHMYGTTFDLAYNNFIVPDTAAGIGGDKLKMILAEVLSKKRDEGRCYVKYELKSPCFHITVVK